MTTRDRRPYKQLVGIIETHMAYINNHLGNIDSHLERLNNSVSDNTKECATNKNSIIWLRWIIGVFVIGLIGVVIKLIM